MHRAFLLILLVAAALSQPARPSPQDYYRRSMGDPGLSWVAHYYQPTFVRAYQAWKDPAWLDWAVRYADFLAAKMQTGPNGYKGWIGPWKPAAELQGAHRVREVNVSVGDAVP